MNRVLDPHLDCGTCGRSIACGSRGVSKVDEYKRCTRCGRMWACPTCLVPVAAKDWQRDVCDCCERCGAVEDLHEGNLCSGCCTDRRCQP